MSVKTEILEIISNHFELEQGEVNEQMSADDVDDWDSLSHITLIAKVESHFKIRFEGPELSKLENIGGLISIVSEKI